MSPPLPPENRAVNEIMGQNILKSYRPQEEALDRIVWRNGFEGGFGPVVRQNTE